MTRRVAIAVAIIVFGLGGAWAVTPFGGDDSGFIPPDPDNLKYESKIAKILSKFQKCVFKCYDTRASGKLADDTVEDGCESACQLKYDTSASKLTAPAPASGCLNTLSLRQLWEADIDAFNSQIYCDNTGNVPFGGDDTGFISTDVTILKCERKIGSNTAKLVKCDGTCHQRRAAGKIADPNDEETCEDNCDLKFTRSNANVTGCPVCLNGDTVAMTFRNLSDTNNVSVFCAQ